MPVFVLWESLTCETSSHPRSASLRRPLLIRLRHISHQRASIGSRFSHLHLEHAGSDTFIVSCAPATLWPASQWLSLYYSPPSCITLASESTEHHQQAHFSLNSADNAGEPPQSYLSYLLLSKNSLVGPCNYRLITAVAHITDSPFLLSECQVPYLMPCSWDTQYVLVKKREWDILIGSYLLA